MTLRALFGVFFILRSEAMNKPLKEQILEKIYGKTEENKPFFEGYEHNFFNTSNKSQKRSTEVLTEKDIKGLMGINRPVYARAKGGAYRRIR